ncbi:peptidase S8, partial [Streptomyces sp. TRM68416]|nr:peptidase S8 [Streptomyces sp. TRM68416]
LKAINRDGTPSENWGAFLLGTSGLARDKFYFPYDADGTATVRVPKGGYILDSNISVDADDATKGLDWLAQPKLTVNKNTTVTLDARTAKPVDITVPDAAAKSEFASPGFDLTVGDSGYGFVWFLDSYANFGSKGLGPKITDGSLSQHWDGHWSKGAKAQYSVVGGGKVQQLATGYTKHYKASELATVKVGMGASSSGKKGAVGAVGWLPDVSGASSIGISQKLPGTRTLYLSTTSGVKWGLDFEQIGGVDAEGWPITEAYYTLGSDQTFKAGRTYSKKFNTAVFGPNLNADFGLYRERNNIYGYLPLFADGAKHAGSSLFTSVNTSLYRNGTKVGSHDDPLFGEKMFKVPSGDAEYKLTTSVKRSVKVAAASTRIDASWTFRSKKPASDLA